MTYSEKLRDPRWQKKRLEIFNRDGFSCRYCGRDDTSLAVHHLSYINGIDPWDYDNKLLITLCEDCHEDDYSSKEEYELLLIKTIRNLGFLSDDLREIALGFSCLNLNCPPHVYSKIISFTLSNKKIMKCIEEKYFKSINKHGVKNAIRKT